MIFLAKQENFKWLIENVKQENTFNAFASEFNNIFYVFSSVSESIKN